MKTLNWIILVSGFTVLSGCASTPSLPPLPPAGTTTTLPTSNEQDATSNSSSASASRDADADTDRDSIVDSQDNCADSDPRVMVDLSGCEIAMGAIDGLSFGPAVVELDANAQSALDLYIEAMLRYPDVTVSVEAHTDNRGTAAANLELSKERVLSVVRYMVAGGVSPDRIKPFGYGESRPRAANATAQGREQNRRVEIKVLEGLS